MPQRNDADLKTDIADIKSSLQFLCKSVDELKQSNTTNENKIKDVLKSIKSNDERIEQLEHRVNDLEQYSQKRYVIVKGLNMHGDSVTRSRYVRTSTQINDGDEKKLCQIRTTENERVSGRDRNHSHTRSP